MRPTIKDVARLSGTSTATVSRVANNADHVDPQTRERVQAVLQQLDYRPNASARALVQDRSKTIMVLVPNIANSYFAELTKFISRFSRGMGYRVLLGDLDENTEVEAHYLSMLKERWADGLIAAPVPNSNNIKYLLDLVRMRVPVVLIDSHFEELPINYVAVDNKYGGRLVVDYLYSRGHRKIAFVAGDINFQTNYERYTGYVEGLGGHGIPLNKDYCLINRSTLEAGGVEGMDQLLGLNDPPTAVFAANDLVAIGCISSVLRHGLHVPEDVAVVGYDDIHASALLEIPLTTVAQPMEEIARKAVDVVIRRIDAHFGEFDHLFRSYPTSRFGDSDHLIGAQATPVK